MSSQPLHFKSPAKRFLCHQHSAGRNELMSKDKSALAFCVSHFKPVVEAWILGVGFSNLGD